MLYAIPAALGLGALHSLEPGHGKGVMTAYLISSRARLKDAVLLGAISSIAHTASIVLLSFVASSAMKLFLPEHLSYWIQLLSGIIITALGVKMLNAQLRPKVVVVETVGHKHHESCDHQHKMHHHMRGLPTSRTQLIMIGFFTGLIPCPSAMAIFLAAIAEDRIPAGMGLVLAFSAGSAIAMSTIGMMAIRAGSSLKILEKYQTVQSLSVVSSVLIVFLGLYVVYRSVMS